MGSGADALAVAPSSILKKQQRVSIGRSARVAKELIGCDWSTDCVQIFRWHNYLLFIAHHIDERPEERESIKSRKVEAGANKLVGKLTLPPRRWATATFALVQTQQTSFRW